MIRYKNLVKKVEFALDKTKFCLVSVKASCTCVVFIKRYSQKVIGPNEICGYASQSKVYTEAALFQVTLTVDNILCKKQLK